jgi:S1-C subfamily serine protease
MSEQHQPEEAIGTVTHYFSHLSVAAVNLSDKLRVGDRIHIQGHTTDLAQTVDSLQIDRAAVAEAGPGDDVALKVTDHVREHDRIFREA